MKGKGFVLSAVLACLAFPSPALAQWPPAPRADWDAELSVHAWAWSAEGTVDVEEGAPASFGDISGPFDPGASVRIETRSKFSTLMLGATYVHFAQERDVEMPDGTAHGALNTAQVIVDGGGGFRLAPDFELLGAARYYLLVSHGMLDSGDRSWMDVFVGGRITKPVGAWALSIRGDIGAGGSKLAWFGNAVLARRVGSKTTLRAEYRILSADRGGDGTPHLGWDVMQNGLGLGFGFGL